MDVMSRYLTLYKSSSPQTLQIICFDNNQKEISGDCTFTFDHSELDIKMSKNVIKLDSKKVRSGEGYINVTHTEKGITEEVRVFLAIK